jgi:hypothetical protein
MSALSSCDHVKYRSARTAVFFFLYCACNFYYVTNFMSTKFWVTVFNDFFAKNCTRRQNYFSVFNYNPWLDSIQISYRSYWLAIGHFFFPQTNRFLNAQCKNYLLLQFIIKFNEFLHVQSLSSNKGGVNGNGSIIYTFPFTVVSFIQQWANVVCSF